MSSNRIRRVMASTIAAGMLLAVAPAASFAQDEGSSIIPAALNAATVDGLSAVGSKAAKGKRAGKLVATDRKGFLPSNIIKPKWGFIKNKPAAFRDGRITWAEVIGKPADNAGVTQTMVSIEPVWNIVPASAKGHTIVAECPAGSKVVGGGFGQEELSTSLVATESWAYTPTSWIVFFDNLDTNPHSGFADAMCLSTQGVAIASPGGFNTSSRKK